MKVIVTKRSDDYHACQAGKTAVWGCGKTADEAIGSLIRAHQDRFNITIVLDK